MIGQRLNKILFANASPRKIKDLLDSGTGALERFHLTHEELEALRADDFLKLSSLGANPYLVHSVYRTKIMELAAQRSKVGRR